MILRKESIDCQLGSGATNVYFLQNEVTKEMIIVDPASNTPYICEVIDKMQGTLVAILLTHAHFDHIMALANLKIQYPDVPIYCGKGDEELLKYYIEEFSQYQLDEKPIEADVYIEESVLEIANFKIEAIKTPGHSRGSTCYYIREENCLLSGDTLFLQSVGRTDFGNPQIDGNHEVLIKSIKRLFSLVEEEAMVYPGHGPKTSVAFERKNNPFL